jgi:hypothetical protein
MLETKIEQDLKVALLNGDSLAVSTLRGLKSVILNVKVATIRRGTELPDAEVISILSKEAKKRQESADMYLQGGDKDRSNKELAEKKIIETYLPAQFSEAEIADIVERVLRTSTPDEQKSMGLIIGKVKEQANGAADGAIVARIVKEKISQ